MNIIVLYTNDLNECIVRHMEARYQLVEFYIANVAETYVKEASDIVTMAFPSIENVSVNYIGNV